MKAAIYYRVSTDNQEAEGTSLQTQLEACLKYCRDKDYDVVHRFSEAYSGLTLDRPKLNELRELVRNGEIQAVIAYTLDRLSRDPVNFIILQDEIEKAGVELILVTEDLDSSDQGKLIGHIKGYAAKLEVEKIRERTGRGRRERVKSGKLPTGGKLYGYKYIKGRGTGQGIRVINENEAKWVRQWRDWILEDGQTLYAITLRMRALPVATPMDKRMWQISTIYNILTNPAIAGRTCCYRYSKAEKERVEIPDATPAIISWEDYEAIQQKLAQNRSQSKRSCKLEYLLRGHIFCKQCRRSYKGKSKLASKKTNRYLRYYQCSGYDYLVSPIKCKNRRWNADYLESQVWNAIRKLLLNPELVATEAKRLQEESKQPNSFQRELANVQTRLKELDAEQYNLLQLAQKGFPDTMVEQENKKINDLRASLQQWKAEMESKKEKAVVAAKCLGGVERFCKLATRNLDELTYDDKRLALEAMAIKVWIEGDNVTVDGAIPVFEEGTLVSMTS
ncbi:recombinase family protein [Chloroflexota bacterium]